MMTMIEIILKVCKNIMTEMLSRFCEIGRNYMYYCYNVYISSHSNHCSIFVRNRNLKTAVSHDLQMLFTDIHFKKYLSLHNSY